MNILVWKNLKPLMDDLKVVNNNLKKGECGFYLEQLQFNETKRFNFFFFVIFCLLEKSIFLSFTKIKFFVFFNFEIFQYVKFWNFLEGFLCYWFFKGFVKKNLFNVN